ncbi:10331_t:CDS:2, partial [Gigaspora rosea]
NDSPSKPTSNSSPKPTSNSSPKVKPPKNTQGSSPKNTQNSSPKNTQNSSPTKPSLIPNKLLASAPKATAASSSDKGDKNSKSKKHKTSTTPAPSKTASDHQSTSPSTLESDSATPLPSENPLPSETNSSNTESSNTESSPSPTTTGTPNSAQAPLLPCLTGDSINSLSCQDSTHYYCNVTDNMCYSRVEDNSPCQEDTVCDINSICSGNVCVPTSNSNNNHSSIDGGKVAMIIGPILGALLLFALLFLFFYRRKKKRRDSINFNDNNSSYPFSARPNSFSSKMVMMPAGAINRRNSPEEYNDQLENQTNTSTTTWNQSYISTTESVTTFNEVSSEQSTESVRLSKFMLISNVLNISTRTETPVRPFLVNGGEISSAMNSPTLPIEDLTDRGSTQSYFTNNSLRDSNNSLRESNRDSDVLPNMDQDVFRKSPESVYLGLEFTTQPEARTNKGRYTMGSIYSTFSTYSTDYTNYPGSPLNQSYNLLRGVQTTVTTGKVDHSRLRNDSFNSTYSTASSYSTSNNTSDSDHTLTLKNMHSPNRSDGQS